MTDGTAPAATTRRCGRCRESFPIDPAGEQPTGDWWVCDTCRIALFPRRGTMLDDGRN